MGVNINPYVAVRVGDQRRVTTTQRGTNCPFYNEVSALKEEGGPERMGVGGVNQTGLIPGEGGAWMQRCAVLGRKSVQASFRKGTAFLCRFGGQLNEPVTPSLPSLFSLNPVLLVRISQDSAPSTRLAAGDHCE